jgi:hypothetical protein
MYSNFAGMLVVCHRLALHVRPFAFGCGRSTKLAVTPAPWHRSHSFELNRRVRPAQQKGRAPLQLIPPCVSQLVVSLWAFGAASGGVSALLQVISRKATLEEP